GSGSFVTIHSHFFCEEKHLLITVSQSKILGVIPYIDPKRFDKRRKSDNTPQPYTLNVKSDVYSIGVLLWEISSGRLPFYVEGEEYDIGLAIEILQGLRESIIPDTPKEYVKIYTECWDSEPDNRPAMIKVVDELNAIITKTNIIESDQINNEESNLQLSEKLTNSNCYERVFKWEESEQVIWPLENSLEEVKPELKFKTMRIDRMELHNMMVSCVKRFVVMIQRCWNEQEKQVLLKA
ncbi:20735_t:CDS:2, partial [Funneliformis geosporum]